MPSAKTLVRSLAGGEITPEMYGRLDNVKFQTGVALAKNALILPHGPATKRPGTSFVNYAGDSTAVVRIIPFAFSASQTMVIELGDGYARFHTQGATLLVGTPAAYNGATLYTPGDLVSSGGFNYVCHTPSLGNVPTNPLFWYLQTSTFYEIPTPWASADLFVLKYTQDSDVLTVTHNGYAPREIRREGAAKWALTQPVIGASVAAPGIPTIAVTIGTGIPYNKDAFYKVTAVSTDGLQESLSAGASTSTANDLSLPGSKNTVSWVASSITAPSYRVYKAQNNVGRLYGFIGETTDLTFVDDNITPDYSYNPPASTIRLDNAGNYPGAVSYVEQRRAFAGTLNNPQGVYLTRTGTENNMSVSNPGGAEDALSFKIRARQQNAIRHLVPLNDLLALTVGGAWRVFSTDGPILPATLTTKAQTYYGANDVTPALTGHTCLYVEASGRRVRDIGYAWEAQAFTSDDRSIMAPHLFLQYSIVDMAYVKSPDQLLWCVRSDGAMLSMAYVPEHQVFGWSQHHTTGQFESVCVVTEDDSDVLYVVVRRALNEGTVRCIERMESRLFATQSDAFYVDSGLTYRGVPATVITGLDHLNGIDVVALADGAVVRDLLVSGGSITLPVAAVVVHVGIAYKADIQMLPLSIDSMQAGGQGTVRSVDYAYVRVNESGPFLVGPSFDDLTEAQIRTDEPYGSPPRLQSRLLDIFINPAPDIDSQLCLRSEDPTPFTVSSITLKLSTGG